MCDQVLFHIVRSVCCVLARSAGQHLFWVVCFCVEHLFFRVAERAFAFVNRQEVLGGAVAPLGVLVLLACFFC